MDIVGVRYFFAGIDSFIAEMIEKVYALIMMLADVNILSQFGNEILKKVFALVAVFMLFKAALIIINYIINPDDLSSSKKSGMKFLKNVVISLFMLTMATTVFDKMAQLQSIILQDNILGKILLTNAKEDLYEQSNDFKEIGHEISYYVFSNFIDYSRDGALGKVFNSCPNLFLEPDTQLNHAGFPVFMNGETMIMDVYTCASFITHGFNEKIASFNEKNDEKYEYSSLDDSRFDVLDDGSNVEWSQDVLGSSSNMDAGGYHTCKAYLRRSPNCGIPNGVYVYMLINQARETKDTKLMLSHEILSATESDYFFTFDADGKTIGTADDNSTNPDGGDSCFCESCLGKNVRDTGNCKDTNGDYVFEYKYGISTIIGLLMLVMMIILSIDVAIRSVKLAFLQIISPIPIVSYMDVNESNLFKKWLKLYISVYLELFIKLCAIFLSFTFIKMLMDGNFSNIMVLRTLFGKIFFIIGCLFFAKELPDLLSKMFNLNGDTGVGSLFKQTMKFAVGAGAMAVAGIGGATSNLVAGVGNIGEAKGIKGKAGAIGKTALSMLGGAGSASIRTLGEQIKTGGQNTGHNIMRGIYGSSYAREQNRVGNHIGVRATDKVKDLFQIDSKPNLNSDDLKKKIETLKENRDKNNVMIENMLAGTPNSNDIRSAFQLDTANNRVFKDYGEYSSAIPNGIDEATYNAFNSQYEKRDEYNQKIKELEEELEHQTTLNNYNVKKK